MNDFLKIINLISKIIFIALLPPPSPQTSLKFTLELFVVIIHIIINFVYLLETFFKTILIYLSLLSN